MIKFLTKILGGSNEKALKEFMPIVDVINGLESDFQHLSNEDLKSKTNEFRDRLKAGVELDSLLPEAFAVVREAAKRSLSQRHFDVQLIGGITLHQGKIAEMRTGEGKTLVATLAAYLNALKGEGVHVVTVNDYLARRDAQWMGVIYNMLGLSVGALQNGEAYLYQSTDRSNGADLSLQKVERRDAYAADITYGTNNEFGFDYLRDNMVIESSQRVQRQLSYAIVDEVDNILVDEARTPLIISGPAEESGKEYYRFAKLVPSLNPDLDWVIDEKHRSVSLTAEGMGKIENLLKVDNLYDPANFRLVHFIENALKARTLFEKDKEYVVSDGEVMIVDEFTGRLMAGRRYSDGLHQAIEAKEGLQVRRETITYATITLQNYFRMYIKLAGMTGTAATEAEEFWKIYKLEVVEVPTNVPMIRQDLTDLVYRDQKAKYNAVVNEISDRHQKGQPVLVGTTDISKSELIGKMLAKIGIKHKVLNAKQHEMEAAIVAQAGRLGAVTVATNMAGRGTDIVLGGSIESLDISSEDWISDHKKVVELGGLHIVGTERHEARRIDNQLRGRSGRQGDSGSSRFFVALDDELMRRFGGDRVKAVMDWAGFDEDASIENKMVSRTIENSQVKVEAFHFDIRKHLVDYDDVVNTHRDIIYEEREKVLSGTDLKSNIQSMIEREIQNIISNYMQRSSQEDRDLEGFFAELQTIFFLNEDVFNSDVLRQMGHEELEKHVLEYASSSYEDQEADVTSDTMRVIEREVMLRVMDAHWVQHLTSMENLRQGIGLYAYGQRDPLVMYKKQGHELFQGLLDRIQYDIVHTIYHLNLDTAQRKKSGSLREVRNARNVASSPSSVDATGRKIGRNDPCSCGSGKKYKKCHGS